MPEGQGKCIDAGAGDGKYKRLVVSKGYEYTGIDINPAGPDVIYGDIANIPFPNEYFDKAISIDVIEEVEDDLKAVKELYRVLKPMGTLLLHTPNSGQTHILAEFPENPHHVRKGYTNNELDKLLSKSNFKEIEVHPTFNILENVCWEIINLMNKECKIEVQRLLDFDPAKYRNLGWIVCAKKTKF